MTLWAAIGCVLMSAVSGPPVEVQVTLDPPEIPFHKQARYTIAVDVTGDIEVTLPEGVERFGGVTVHDVQRHTQVLEGGRRRITETYLLDPVWPGLYPIAPVEVRWGEDNVVTVPSPSLRVRDLTEEERAQAERFEPNAGPLLPPRPFWMTWWFWTLAAVMALLAAGGLLAVWRHRKRWTAAASGPPPWEVAYARLQDLDQKHLPKTGRFEPYYIALSSILRFYIEDRFELHAPEQTTPEFLDAASRHGVFSETHQGLLADFLRHCDRVKFARYVPTLPEMERSFDVVLRFVEETVPKVDSANKEAAA